MPLRSRILGKNLARSVAGGGLVSLARQMLSHSRASIYFPKTHLDDFRYV